MSEKPNQFEDVAHAHCAAQPRCATAHSGLTLLSKRTAHAVSMSSAVPPPRGTLTRVRRVARSFLCPSSMRPEDRRVSASAISFAGERRRPEKAARGGNAPGDRPAEPSFHNKLLRHDSRRQRERNILICARPPAFSDRIGKQNEPKHRVHVRRNEQASKPDHVRAGWGGQFPNAPEGNTETKGARRQALCVHESSGGEGAQRFQGSAEKTEERSFVRLL